MKYLCNRVTLGTLSICILIFLFAMFVMVSSGTIAEQAKMMHQHPYRVKSAAQTMLTRLMEMQLYLLPMMLASEKTGTKDVNTMLRERDTLQDATFAVIRQYYLGPRADIAALETAVTAVRRARRQVVLDCEGIADLRVIMDSLAKQVHPPSEAMNAALQRIMDFADARVAKFQADADSTRTTMIWGTALLCLLLIALVIFVSLSERRKNRALQDALADVRKANAAKQEFFSRMSHEIRTPMNAIIGMTAIAAKHLGDKERVGDCLTKIAVSSKHLLELINDVLDIAKIEGGKLSFTSAPFDFRHFIDTLTAIIYPQTLARQQQFEITISGLSEEILIGDELRLNQVLINLLSNSIKFTPPEGEIRLEITRLRDENTKTLLQFVVRDTGIGMSEEFLARLYTPFVQADNITKNYGGTGLGLSIVKNLVSLMSGSIAVESEEGKGTTFILELPFDLPEQNQNPKEEQQALGWDSLSVLVIDDDLVTCEHAMLLLNQFGVRGDWANSGEEALGKVAKAQKEGRDYAVCLIDWRMPGMDGLETARCLRKQVGEETPIIIISSYDWSDIEEDAREAGVNAFISKPLFASALYNVLMSIHYPGTIAASAAQQKEEYDFKGKKILLAEDNPLNQEIALELLQSAGCTVDCANDGQEVLNMFQGSAAGEFALILMDVQMPHMNGYEATRAIRATEHPDAKTIPILAMTANAFSSDIHAAKESGMDGHLAKPIDVAILFRTVAAYLREDSQSGQVKAKPVRDR